MDYLKIPTYDDMTADLFKSNEEYVGRLLNDWFVSIEGKLTDTSTVTYKIPSTLKERGFSVKQNPIFDIIKAEMLLEVNNMVFVIRDVKEVEAETIYKEIKAYTREVKLTKRDCILSDNLMQLQSDDINVSDGIMDDLEVQTSWRAGHIDESARLDNTNDGNMPKYRYFEDTDATRWLDFLRNTMAESFDCITLFNTKEKQVDILDKEAFGDHSGLTLSVDNFIKDINVSRGTSELTTRLYCDVEGMYITDVNPYAQNYVENFSYFIENELMSEELIYALNRHEEILSEMTENIVIMQESIKELRSQQLDYNTEIQALEEEIVGLKALQSAYIKAEDNVNLATVSKKLDEVEAKLNEALAELEKVNNKIQKYQADIEVLSTSFSREAVKDNGEFLFTPEMLEELDEYIFEDSFSETTYVNEESLYEAMLKQLAESCRPALSIDITASDFIKYTNRNVVIENTLNLGDIITAVSKRFGEFEMRVVAYTMSKNNLKLTLSNDTLYENSKGKLVGVISQIRKANNIINNYKGIWNATGRQTGFIDTLMTRGLDLSTMSINGASTKNKIMVLESGMYIIDAENEDNQLYLGSSLVAFTDNKWRTSSIGVDKNGIIAQSLTGRINLGDNIVIGSPDGTLFIDDESMIVRAEDKTVRCLIGKTKDGEFGIRIYDSTGKNLALSEEGILQSYNFNYSDNLASGYPITVDLDLDDDVIDIRKFTLTINPKSFRSYSKETEEYTEQSLSTSSSTFVEGGNDHTHTTVFPAHKHKLTHGIYLGSSAELQVYVNGEPVALKVKSKTSVDIKDFLKVGTNEIRVTTNSGVSRVDLSARGKVFTRF